MDVHVNNIENREMELAKEFVQFTDKHIFLTGNAGTGKTTFLKNLKNVTAKRMIITAPTGVAAINAGGVTLHSFFQLPFTPFIPDSDLTEENRRKLHRFSKEKKRIIKNLDLLVIDEISMVRADVLDFVDLALRRHRRNEKPFGGVQLLMIGDLHQLPPVAKDDERELLKSCYESLYFFSSHSLRRTEMITVELKHIYRQTDSAFIRILNNIREDNLDSDSIAELNKRYIPQYSQSKKDGAIILTTHNSNARSINSAKLDALPYPEHHFKAEVSGDFPEHAFPTDRKLILKKDAIVMFLRNDASSEKRYYNGKIGIVEHISDDSITVKCQEDKQSIKVVPLEWENIEYTLDTEKNEINEVVTGSFKQIPLKPAWAITIHKSQGLTFDKVLIDAEAAFAHGQVYVAFSRCKTLDGIILTSPFSPHSVVADQELLSFNKANHQKPLSAEQLMEAKMIYQQKIIRECFDFDKIHKYINILGSLLRKNKSVVQVFGHIDFDLLQEREKEDIYKVSRKLATQLESIFKKGILPESDNFLQERLRKASIWFRGTFDSVFCEFLSAFRIETDNKELRKRINHAVETLNREIALKIAGMATFEKGFSITDYLKALSKAEVDSFVPAKAKRNRAPEYSKADIEHPELFELLRAWRHKKANELNVNHFQIIHQRVLIQIAVLLPENKTELKAIKGIGKRTLERYGDDILDIVANYRNSC
jgi:DNA-directed RNA polymerase subunit F